MAFIKMNDCRLACIIGPSHAVRWSWHIRDEVVRAGLAYDKVIGRGGAPIWSKQLFEGARRAVAQGGTIGIMAGDFRFGNSVALQTDYESLPLFIDGHFGINSSAMTQDFDRIMFKRGVDTVKVWCDTFPDQVRFLFWDLFGRQVLDRMEGRHIENGKYLHPVFNYDEVVACVPKGNLADLAPLLRLPMHEVRRLFIDSSCHPSQIGYLFLNSVLCGERDVIRAYREAVVEVEEELFRYARKITGKAGPPVLLTGRSVWIDTVVNYLGESGLRRLAAEGLIIAPINDVRGQPSLKRILEEFPLRNCAPIVFSAMGRDISSRLAAAFNTDTAYWQTASWIDWEGAASPAIEGRRETPKFIYGSEPLPRPSSVLIPNVKSHMVEQGPLGEPSWTGITHGLKCVRDATLGSIRAGK